MTRTDAVTSDDSVVAVADALSARRELDAVQWTADGNLATADEGDLAATPSGGRGWTVFSARGETDSSSGSSADRRLPDRPPLILVDIVATSTSAHIVIHSAGSSSVTVLPQGLRMITSCAGVPAAPRDPVAGDDIMQA